MEYRDEDWLIKRWLDDEDYLLLWPPSEWVIALAALGILVVLHHVLWGVMVMLVILLLLLRGRSSQRGKKAHCLWRLQILRGSKHGLACFPSAHAMRFDN